ncbi:unnamed protein product [Wickerhamomyces anomalus]
MLSRLRSGVLRGPVLSARQFSKSALRRAEVEVTVDNVKVKIENGSSIIQACDKAGVVVPRYCYHDKLAIAGNCQGMVVHTDSERVKNAREGITEFLLQNHPLDCPICDQGGECDLQDQSMRYGADRGRFKEVSGKRAVENKAIGPLIKTSMNRCIHCTRCVRFLNDVAGAPRIWYIWSWARPWELKRTESVDVLDGVGSNIRVDCRGIEVMRVLPRLNDYINEEWISDKTRYACDGLKTQRLTTPLIRNGNKFEAATWDEALSTIASAFTRIQPQGHEIKGISGALADVESMVVLKDLVNKLGSENLTTDDIDREQEPSPYGANVKSNYTFNSSIVGVEDADQILLVGTNPRHEASVLNARIRGTWLDNPLEIHQVGQKFESTFDINYLGEDANALKSALSGEVGKKLAAAKNPMIIVGSGVVNSPDAKAIYSMVGNFVKKNKNFITPEWNGYNLLQREASRAGALEIGFHNSSKEAASTKPKFIYLLGADEVKNRDIPRDAFVVYQGHHGDLGASFADVILPGSAYTEKTATYVNTEGRVQSTRAATSPPGSAREDWKILRALAEYMNVELNYDDIYSLKSRLGEISPSLVYTDVLEPVSAEIAKLGIDTLAGLETKITGAVLKNPIENFWMTDVISRSSVTMAKCIQSFGEKGDKVFDERPEYAMA